MTQVGVTTDVNGAFSIKVPDGANSLTVSYVGYADQAISIEGQNQINVILKQGTAENSTYQESEMSGSNCRDKYPDWRLLPITVQAYNLPESY